MATAAGPTGVKRHGIVQAIVAAVCVVAWWCDSLQR